MHDISRIIDGSHGEGGGQLLRTAVGLAALTGTPIRVHSIRARRRPPGLAPQHLAAVRAVAELCQARTEDLVLRSTEISFEPGPIRAGDFRFDVGTAGSITLVLQALLPVMLAAPDRCSVTVTGGTDVRAAPPLDYLRYVTLPLLSRMSARAELEVHRRGYYPRGGGTVCATAWPCALRPFRPEEAGGPEAVAGLAHVAHLPGDIAERMACTATARLAEAGVAVHCATAVLGEGEAIGRGGAIVMWTTGRQTVLGAGRVAERGVPAETLGTVVGDELAADLKAGATLDVHSADQLLLYCALAGGESRFTTRELTPHAHTAMWLIERFLPARFSVASVAGGLSVTVRSEGTS